MHCLYSFKPWHIMLISMLSLLPACKKDAIMVNRELLDDQNIKNFLEQHNINAQHDPSGIYYEKLEENIEGSPVELHDIVKIWYQMSTLDGTLVYEMDKDSLPIEFENKDYGIIPSGVNYGVGLMKTGETYRLYIPSYLAYESYGNSSYFPPYSNFIIDIKVLGKESLEEEARIEQSKINEWMNINSVDEVASSPGGLVYVQTKKGTGKQPVANSQVTFHFTRKYLDGTIIRTTKDDEPVTIYLDGTSAVKGLEMGLKMMHEGEKATFILPSSLAFGSSTAILPEVLRNDLVRKQLIPNEVRPFSPLIYEVELIKVN
ncbi:MAG TPA: FKBP-type peptidyl-prolyl cis-trans isomerase [Bacteroidales bacterium]|nr:FKBP-type peptidyl-prolyl cis-trans isomerase [Bacteroidales bacterium]